MEQSHGGEARWRGNDGPLHVTRGPRDNPLHDAFVESAVAAGYIHTPDYNGYRQEGFGPADMTVWKGRRWSSANAYLRPALKREMMLQKGALVEKVLFQGSRAIGVSYLHNGRKHLAKASAEVICIRSDQFATDSATLRHRARRCPAGGWRAGDCRAQSCW